MRVQLLRRGFPVCRLQGGGGLYSKTAIVSDATQTKGVGTCRRACSSSVLCSAARCSNVSTLELRRSISSEDESREMCSRSEVTTPRRALRSAAATSVCKNLSGCAKICRFWRLSDTIFWRRRAVAPSPRLPVPSCGVSTSIGGHE